MTRMKSIWGCTIGGHPRILLLNFLRRDSGLNCNRMGQNVKLGGSGWTALVAVKLY
jgi:hypothetical protein